MQLPATLDVAVTTQVAATVWVDAANPALAIVQDAAVHPLVTNSVA